ncbi:MAG: hypothetical protein JSS09_06735, partial [Verrucomicrobia bacterium]|nr:hypothetical protein [Verrucomicrobiota bacterium]
MKLILFIKIILLIFVLPLLAEEEAKSSWHQYDPMTYQESWQLTKEKKLVWVYNAIGHRISSSDWIGTTTYGYDKKNDHLSCVIAPSGEKTFYTHDAQGNLESITYPCGKKVSYDYTPNSLTIILPKGKISYFYDGLSNLLLKKELSNGVSTDYKYDKDRRISDIIHKKSKNRLIAHYHFEYDPMGNQILFRKTTPSKEITTTYTYDKLYRLTKAESSN